MGAGGQLIFAVGLLDALGIEKDIKGHVVGYVKGAVNEPTKLERLKGLKKQKPLKAIPQLEPLKPPYRNNYSAIPLERFLSMGTR